MQNNVEAVYTSSAIFESRASSVSFGFLFRSLTDFCSYQVFFAPRDQGNQDGGNFVRYPPDMFNHYENVYKMHFWWTLQAEKLPSKLTATWRDLEVKITFVRTANMAENKIQRMLLLSSLLALLCVEYSTGKSVIVNLNLASEWKKEITQRAADYGT